MFEYHPHLVNYYCERMLNNSEKEMKHSWILKICSNSPQLYNELCRKMMETYQTLLPKFIDNICKDNGNIQLLYPCYEQPCVILCLMSSILELPLRDVHNSKLMYELLQLWLIHPESVQKLIRHFPCIIHCITECSDKDENAKRLCIHLMSCNFKRNLE